MNLKPGLIRRKATYYARVRVPKLLVEAIGKVEIKVSLRTTDKNEANARLAVALDEIRRRLADAAGNSTVMIAVPSPVPVNVGKARLMQIARDWLEWRLQATENALWKPDSTLSNSEARYEVHLRLSEFSQPDEALYDGMSYSARQLLTENGHPNPTHGNVETLTTLMIRGEIDCLNFRDRFLQGDIRPIPLSNPLVLPVGGLHDDVLGLPSPVGPRADLVTLDQAIERFEINQTRKNVVSALDGYKPGFRVLREIVGGDALLTSIGRKHTTRVQEVFSQLPPNASKIFPQMTLLQAANHAVVAGMAPIGAVTAANYLSNLSSFFTWAVNEHLIEKSPAKNLRASQKPRRKDELRRPFSEQNLVALFSAEHYRGSYRDVDAQKNGRYWVPLLALYQGARCNELCQLEVSDVDVMDGVPCIHIREESESGAVKHLKTKNAARTIPVHPVLRSLGFLDYAGEMKKAGHSQLFPDLTLAATGYYSDNFSKWFGRFKKARGLEDRRLTFHSFRHGFRDACRSADIPLDLVEQVCGWAGSGSMAGHYGVGYDMNRLEEELAKIFFPTVESLLLSRDQVVEDAIS